MKQMKRILALVLCVALVFTLSACIKKSSDDSAPLTTAVYDEKANGTIKVAVLRDASAIGLWQLFDNARYEIKIAESFEEAQTLLSSGAVAFAACPANVVTDDERVIGVVCEGTVSLVKAGEDAGLTVQKDTIPTCFVAGAAATNEQITAFVADAQISVEMLYRDLSAAAAAINEQSLFTSDVNEDIVRDCDAVFLTGAEMQEVLARPYTTTFVPTTELSVPAEDADEEAASGDTSESDAA